MVEYHWQPRSKTWHAEGIATTHNRNNLRLLIRIAHTGPEHLHHGAGGAVNTSNAFDINSTDHANPMADYVLLDADLESDSDAAVRVWDGIIGWYGRLSEMYAAFYLDCPLGRPLLKLLRHEPSGATVGTVGAGPRRILWRGHEIRAGVVSHLAILPAHRSVHSGAFLLSRAHRTTGPERFDVLYGLPSRKGAALAERCGYKTGGELIRHVKVLRYQNYLERHLPRFAALIGGKLINLIKQARDSLQRMGEPSSPQHEWVDHVDPRMEQLWQKSPHGDCWTTIRDTAMLQWRFDRLPSVRRRYLLLGSVRGGELSAWFACDTHVRDPKMLTVNDFWSTQGVQGIDPVAIRTLYRAAYREGFHAIELRFTGAAAIHARLTAEGFIERSRQPMIVCWQNPDLAGDLEGRLHITDIENDG